MRLLQALVIGIGLAGAATAQNNQNLFEIYPGATTYTLRQTAGSNEESFLEVPGGAYTGVGDDGTICKGGAVRVVSQDQNGCTLEQYYLVARNPNPANTPPGPAGGAAGIRWQTGFLPFPTNTTCAGAAFIITVTFGGLPPTVPCEGNWFLGIGFTPPNGPVFPADGQSVHGADYVAGTAGDNPRASAPPIHWGGVGGLPGGPATFLSDVLAERIGLRTAGHILNMGALNPANTRQAAGTVNFGAGGIYPDVSGAPRSDGLNVRVTAAQYPAGASIVFLSSGPGIPGGVPVGGITGRFWLNPGVLFPLGVMTLSATGVGTLVAAPPASLSPSLVGAVLSVQGIDLNATFTAITLTNRGDWNL